VSKQKITAKVPKDAEVEGFDRQVQNDRARLNRLSAEIVDAAIKVHTVLGPGLLESAYEACLSYELGKRGMHVATQVALPVVYERVRIDAGYRIDLLVEDAIILELKSVEKLMPIHEAQLLSYLKLSRKRLGLLINFNAIRLRDGIKRMVNQF